MIFEITRYAIKERACLGCDSALEIEEDVLKIDTEKMSRDSVERLHRALRPRYCHAENLCVNRHQFFLYHFSSVDCRRVAFLSSECLCVRVNPNGSMEFGLHLPPYGKDMNRSECPHRVRLPDESPL